MKIVLVMGMYSFGGAERVMCHLANHFAENGNDVTLITVSNAEETYVLDERVKRVNGLNWSSEWDSVLKLRKCFIKVRPDIIISFLTHINIAVILASRFLGIPVIVSERNDPSKSATSKLRIALRKITYPWAAGLVFQTDDAMRYFAQNIQRKGIVIPNPLFLTEKAIPFEERNNEIVSVGRFVPQKRQDLIVKAFKEITKEHPEYHLNFYGNGEKKDDVLHYIHKHHLNGKISVFDSVPDLHKRMKNAKFFILMSQYEGMPNALMEAMGLGLVCISSDCPCGGPRYLIKDGENGLLVPVDDVEQLTEKLKTIIEDDRLQRSISKSAQEIRDRLSAANVFFKWDQLVMKLTKAKR